MLGVGPGKFTGSPYPRSGRGEQRVELLPIVAELLRAHAVGGDPAGGDVAEQGAGLTRAYLAAVSMRSIVRVCPR